MSEYTNFPNTNTQLKCNRNRTEQNNTQYQFLHITQQLHDATATIEGLRRDLYSLQGHLYEAERQGDMAEMCYQMEKKRNLDVSPVKRQNLDVSPIRRPRCKYEHNFKFRDGGEARIYCNSDDEDPLMRPGIVNDSKEVFLHL